MSCLGVLAGVPCPLPSRGGSRSGPADQAPGVVLASRPVGRPAGAGCLRLDRL